MAPLSSSESYNFISQQINLWIFPCDSGNFTSQKQSNLNNMVGIVHCYPLQLAAWKDLPGSGKEMIYCEALFDCSI